MSFLCEYIRNPRMIGAVAPSGSSLSCKMMEPIDFKKAKVIVEYGPGTGSFTKELVIRRKVETALILIEQNRQFYEQLKALFANQPNLHILHGSAENIEQYLNALGYAGADYIVSGLPFASLPREVSDRILTATKNIMGGKGRFITFQYTLVKRKFFERYFRITQYRKEIKNLPPAYVLVMKNEHKEHNYAK